MDFFKNKEKIEALIGYTFSDETLLRQAFVRTSFCNEANRRAQIPYQSNEVLEFFGDSALSLALVTFFIERRTERYARGIKTELDEGDFSNIRSKLSDKKNLSESILKMGLQDYLIMGEGDAQLGVERECSVMEDLFESIVGAVYIDSGFDIRAVMRSVEKMMDLSVYMDTKLPPSQSAKNSLQEFCQDKKRRLPKPSYELVSESGPDHKKTYVYACCVDGELLGTGEGKNKKEAEANAALAALTELLKREEIKK
jgi:ribonuclease-3